MTWLSRVYKLYEWTYSVKGIQLLLYNGFGGLMMFISLFSFILMPVIAEGESIMGILKIFTLTVISPIIILCLVYGIIGFVIG